MSAKRKPANPTTQLGLDAVLASDPYRGAPVGLWTGEGESPPFEIVGVGQFDGSVATVPTGEMDYAGTRAAGGQPWLGDDVVLPTPDPRYSALAVWPVGEDGHGLSVLDVYGIEYVKAQQVELKKVYDKAR